MSSLMFMYVELTEPKIIETCLLTITTTNFFFNFEEGNMSIVCEKIRLFLIGMESYPALDINRISVRFKRKHSIYKSMTS